MRTLTSVLATTLTSLVTAAFALTIAVPATHATPMQRLAFDPNAATTLEIHKFEQPDQLGDPATGLPQDTTGLVAVSDATFTATRVPGVDLTTPEGRRAAADLTTADVLPLIAGQPAAASATTNGAGNATLTPLEVGLYYVNEIGVPAGFAASAPFLVPLPLANPNTSGDWLTTVHVYPKNSRASISLEVRDQGAVALGDTVHWTSRSTIAKLPTLDGYRVTQRIDAQLSLIEGATGSVAVAIDCGALPACPALISSTDYTASYDALARNLTIDFTEAGLRKLEQAVALNPDAHVIIDYDTLVLASGELVNEAILYPSKHTIDTGLGLSSVAVTKWGPLSVLVHEQGNAANPVAGASFKLYLSEQDARDGINPVTVEDVSEWITDAQGRLFVEGLRHSGFVNGLDRATSDPLYRNYWVVPTNTPQGWRWVDRSPLAGSVEHSVQSQTLVFELIKDEEISITGGQVGGIGMLAGVLLTASAIAFVSRRRRHETEARNQ